MRYFILFFCLLFGQNTTIQANYSAAQIANYQTISTEVINPIEPIEPKKSKHKSPKPQFDEDLALFTLTFCAIAFVAGLVFFPLAFGLGMTWLWLLISGFELIGLLLAILLLFEDTGTGLKGFGNGFVVFLTTLVAILFLLLKGIELIIIGLSAGLLGMWIGGISLIVALAIVITVMVIINQ